MNTLLAHETAFWISFKPWITEREQLDLYHPNYPQETLSHNICNGFFFPPIYVKD